MTSPNTTNDGFSVITPSRPHELADELAKDVREGMVGTPKEMPPKYFYDARGSELFEAITQLDEYYLTRAETEILEHHAEELVRLVEPEEVLELGSGSSRKTRLLLEAMHHHGCGDRYVPVDVSEAALERAATTLLRDYGWLRVRGFVGDFHTDLTRLPHGPRRLVAFLGSTIGNFDEQTRSELLRDVHDLLEPDDRFLVGLDLVKDPAVLEAAYDDAAGVTAEFNRNMLRVLAKELDVNIPVDAFAHRARWNAERSWVEMILTATREVEIDVPALDLTIHFAEGEDMRTEVSTKFTRSRFSAALAAAQLEIERWFTDRQERFALALVRPH